MAKYLYMASYTMEGAKGLLKDGGTKRRAAIEQLAKSVGGRLESFYYAFGKRDVYAIVDVPDHVASVAASLVVAASGAARVRTVVLITPEEMDEAVKKSAGYRPPGA